MIGIGNDLVDIDRFRRALERTPTLRERLFTEAERSYADARADPTERYAVRFAAKEAVMKALGVGLGEMQMRDIEVQRADSGAPADRAARQRRRTRRELGASGGGWSRSVTARPSRKLSSSRS